MGHEHEVVRPSGGGDQQIVGADRAARALEVQADEGRLLGAAIVEGQARDRLEEALQKQEVPVDTRAVARSVEQLCLHHHAQPHLGRARGLKSSRDGGRAAVQDANADVSTGNAGGTHWTAVSSPSQGYRLQAGPFPGWETLPTW